VLLADVPQWVTDAGVVAGTITVLITFLGLLSRLRPARWLWHQLISEPLGAWLRHQITAVAAPLIEPIQLKVDENAVLLDATAARLDQTTLDLGAHMADEMLLRRVDLENRMLRQQHVDEENHRLREAMGSVEATVMDLHDRVDATLLQLAAGNPEIRQTGPLWDTITIEHQAEPEDEPPEEGT
jgi:hypothetical protein